MIKRKIRSFSMPTKVDLVTRVLSGETKASISREYDVPESTLRGWCKDHKVLNRISHSSLPCSTAPASVNGTALVVNAIAEIGNEEDVDLSGARPAKRRRIDSNGASHQQEFHQSTSFARSSGENNQSPATTSTHMNFAKSTRSCRSTGGLWDRYREIFTQPLMESIATVSAASGGNLRSPTNVKALLDKILDSNDNN